MDTQTTIEILNAAAMIGEKLDDLDAKLDGVTSQLDQLIYRETKSGFDAIHDALRTSKEETRKQRLAYAENALLKTTGLNVSLSTGDIPNSEIIACAHHGLAYITFLRDDQTISARHLLQAFELAPRTARTVLAPQLYQKLFEPICRQIIRNYRKQIVGLHKVGTPRNEPDTAMEWLIYGRDLITGRDPTVVTQSDYDEEVAELVEERECTIDERCREFAREMLST